MSDMLFKEFVHQAKEKASEVELMSHVSQDAKDVLKDLLHILQSMEEAHSAQYAKNADARMLKKKYDAIKQENEVLKLQGEERKKELGKKVAEHVANITVKAKGIKDRHKATKNIDCADAVAILQSCVEMGKLIYK
jgi:outer membrane phospholipase A